MFFSFSMFFHRSTKTRFARLSRLLQYPQLHLAVTEVPAEMGKIGRQVIQNCAKDTGLRRMQTQVSSCVCRAVMQKIPKFLCRLFAASLVSPYPYRLDSKH